jgi:hypothetical protein
VNSSIKPPRDLRCEQRLAIGDHPHRVEQQLGSGVLEQEPTRTGAQPVVDVLVEVEGGDDEDLRRGRPGVGDDAPGRLDTVEDRHSNVHQHHVGTFAKYDIDRFRTVTCFADHVDVGSRAQQHGEATADERLIVGDHDLDGH